MLRFTNADNHIKRHYFFHATEQYQSEKSWNLHQFKSTSPPEEYHFAT